MHRIIALFICFISATPQAHAARYPNAVERSFTLSGEAAKELADLLQVTKKDSEVSLKLSENTAWAVYGLKMDTITPLSNSDGQPTRYNVIRLVSVREPKLTIGPFWEDLYTALPPSRDLEGRYSFSSPGIGTDLVGGDPVGDDLVRDDTLIRILRNLKTKLEWQEQCIEGDFVTMFSKTFTDERGSHLTIKVWCHDYYPQNKRTPGYSLQFVFDEKK